MAYSSYYTVTDWQNLPSQKTALNRTNLVHAENGIKEADTRIVQLDAIKANLSVVNTLVKDVSMNATTGVMIVTLQNGTTKSYDLAIEKVVTNFNINDNNELALTLADGTIKIIDMTRFVYSVASTATVAMSINNRVMTATIVDGSVTMAKLDAAIQTEFRQYMLDAQAARDAALQYQKYAKRYAIGDDDFTGSDTDNAKYYYEQAKTDATTSGQNAQSAADSEATATAQATIATQKATSATAATNTATAAAQTATEKATAAAASEQVATVKATAASASQTAAAGSATAAQESALLAKRYTDGGVVPEDVEDNAKYYYEQTQNLKSQVDLAVKISVPHFYIDATTMKFMSETEATGIRFWYENGKFYGEEITA